MDIAFVSEFLGLDRMFRSVDSASGESVLKVGDLLPMAAGYCRAVVTGKLPELIRDTRLVPYALSLPETSAFPIGAHLSVPIRVEGGRVFGTFCCLSHQARPDLADDHLELVRTFAHLVATELAGDIALHAGKQRKRECIEEALLSGNPSTLFQPIVRLADEAIVGVEALSRFGSEPRRSPDLWFADAHETGMGDRLELLAVKKALLAGAALPAPLSVSINLSPSTVIAGDLHDVLKTFDPSRLVIEITEHKPVEDYEPVLRALAPLRNAGIRVAIDDAGAGYSSLRHVLAMRPDIIKFDVSLTRDIDRDPFRSAMVAALSEFGSRTGTMIVAEGVETDRELATLRGLGVSMGQGFHFGRPESMATIVKSMGSGARKRSRPS